MPVKKATKTQQQSLAAAFKSTPSRITKPSSTPLGFKDVKSVVTSQSEQPVTKTINLKQEEKSEDSEIESQELALKKKKEVEQDEEKEVEEEEEEDKEEEGEEDEGEPAVIKVQRELVLPEEVPEDIAERVSTVTARQVKAYADKLKKERTTPAGKYSIT